MKNSLGAIEPQP
ncbi:rCG56718 [Rattus norvegicus]|uniref:RCG56718 n=1 Tax=Rattus norvegicus TaxID=10116 RepID=A6KEX9_RAT|nr:rCG56718 [Rattus norvegicus]